MQEFVGKEKPEEVDEFGLMSCEDNQHSVPVKIGLVMGWDVDGRNAD